MLSRPTLSPSSSPNFLPPNPLRQVTTFRLNVRKSFTSGKPLSVSVSAAASSDHLQALVFDCDGVILESEHLHRQAYNDAFAHFYIRCPSSSESQLLNWGSDFYDELQNRIGGGKPKMRWFSQIFLLCSCFCNFSVLFSPCVCWLVRVWDCEGTLVSTGGHHRPYSRSLRRPMRTEPSWLILFRYYLFFCFFFFFSAWIVLFLVWLLRKYEIVTRRRY